MKRKTSPKLGNKFKATKVNATSRIPKLPAQMSAAAKNYNQKPGS